MIFKWDMGRKWVGKANPVEHKLSRQRENVQFDHIVPPSSSEVPIIGAHERVRLAFYILSDFAMWIWRDL